MSAPKKPQYHQSEIELHLKCGLAHKYRYIDGYKIPPRAALTIGSSVDAAVTHNLIQKIETNTDLPKDDVLDAYSTAFDRAAVETDFEGKDKGVEKQIGVQLVNIHHEKVAPLIQPAEVQTSFLLNTDAGYDLGGKIDIIEKDGTVADTKTSKGRYSAAAAKGELQPALYDFAYEALKGKPAKGFRYDVLLKTQPRGEKGEPKPERFQRINTKVTPEDRSWLFQVIDNVHRAITAGIAIPASSQGYWCSEDQCGYAKICPKFKRGPK